jgi:hypothetical protein
MQGRGDTDDPLRLRLNELLEVLGTIEGTVGDQQRGARGELQLGHMVSDELAEVVCVTTIPPKGCMSTGTPAWCSTIKSSIAWQVALLFQLWKSPGRIDESWSTKPWCILCEVYAPLLAMLVQHWVFAE